MIDLRLRYATPDEVLRWYVLEEARQLGIKGIDLEKTRVDGGHHDPMEWWFQMVSLVHRRPAAPELAIDAVCVRTFALAGFTSAPNERQFASRQEFLAANASWIGPAAIPMNEVQVARGLGVTVSAVRGALAEARETIRPRLLAMVMEGR